MPGRPVPSELWPYDEPAPKLRTVLSKVFKLLEDLEYDEAAASLKNDAAKHGLKGLASDENGLTLLEYYHARFASSLGPSDHSESSESDGDDESERDEAERVLVDVEAEETSDDDSDENSDSDSGSGSDSDSDSNPHSSASEAKAVQKRKRVVTPPPSDDSSSSDDSDSDSTSDESEARPAKRTKVDPVSSPSDSGSQSPSSSDTDSSSSDSASESASDSSSGSSSSDSDSSSEEDEEEPAPPKKKAKERTGKKENKDTAVNKKLSEAPIRKAHVQNSRKEAQKDGSQSSATLEADSAVETPGEREENSGVHPDRLKFLPQQKPTPKTADGKKKQVPFSRIPTDQYVDPRFASNEYVSYNYADRAYQDLVVTKGKGFTKEKNKKKRGAYRGGAIDLAPKGIKFED